MLPGSVLILNIPYCKAPSNILSFLQVIFHCSFWLIPLFKPLSPLSLPSQPLFLPFPDLIFPLFDPLALLLFYHLLPPSSPPPIISLILPSLPALRVSFPPLIIPMPLTTPNFLLSYTSFCPPQYFECFFPPLYYFFICPDPIFLGFFCSSPPGL